MRLETDSSLLRPRAFLVILVFVFNGCYNQDRPKVQSVQRLKASGVSTAQIRKVRCGMTVEDVFQKIGKMLFSSTVIRYSKQGSSDYYFVVFSPTKETAKTDTEFNFTVEAIVEGETLLSGKYLIPKHLIGNRFTGFWEGSGETKVSGKAPG